MAETISGLAHLTPADQVLDVGCGCGAMVPFFAKRLGEEGCYLGLDVHPPSIQWCRRRFQDDPRLRFEQVPVRSPYGHGRGVAFEEYRFPLPDGAADFVLAKSLFTHLLEPEARHYLAEIRRTLRPGREAIVTAFLFDGSGPPAFPFPAAGSPVRWRRRSHPHAAVAFERRFFESMIREAGLEVRQLLPAVPAGQDVLLLTR
jgi:SAM-dependent methyltransferase